VIPVVDPDPAEPATPFGVTDHEDAHQSIDADVAIADVLNSTGNDDAVKDSLLRDAARLIEWKAGDVIDIDTEDGLEKGVTLLGPAESGDSKQMSVKFADGSVDDWDMEDFVLVVTSKYNPPLLVFPNPF